MRGAKEILTWIPEERPAHDFLKKYGFQAIRYYMQIRAGLDAIPSVPQPADIEIKTFSEGDGEMLMDIHNRGFIDNWNYSPLTMKEIEQWRKGSAFDPEGVSIALHGGKAVAFCKVFVDREYNNCTNRCAHVDQLACDRAFIREGIESYLLYLTGEYARRKGMGVLELDVDAENSSAVGVYEKMGFRQKKKSITYRKEL